MRSQPGKFQSKRLYPGGSFSPWKINLHLILLRNCSSQKQIESMRFISFKSPQEPRGADSQGIKTRKLDFTRISELRFLCLIELAPLGAGWARSRLLPELPAEPSPRGKLGAVGAGPLGALEEGYPRGLPTPRFRLSFPSGAAGRSEICLRGGGARGLRRKGEPAAGHLPALHPRPVWGCSGHCWHILLPAARVPPSPGSGADSAPGTPHGL